MSDVVEEDTKEATAENTDSVTPGQKLKRAREIRNLEQSDIAKELKLDLRFVKALEDGRYNDLPQPVYTAGYVRAYSKLVGLLPDDIVSEYTSRQKASVKSGTEDSEKEHIPSHYGQVQTDLPKSFSVGHGQSEDKRKFNILVSVLAVIVVFAIVWQVSKKSEETATSAVPSESDVKPSDPGRQETPDVKDAPQEKTGAIGSTGQKIINLSLPKLQKPDSDDLKSSKQIDSVRSDGAKIAKELTENADKILELSIHYTQNSWIDIRDATGKSIIRELGIAGDSHTVSGVAPFDVLLGYSPGVSIELDGKPYDMSPYKKKRVSRFVLKEDSVESNGTNQIGASSNNKNQDGDKKPAAEDPFADDF